MQLCFFEDSHCQQLNPLLLTRPADDLRTGILTISEKWKRSLNATVVTRTLRKELEGVFEQGEIDPSGSCIWINARYLPVDTLTREIRELGIGSCLQTDSTTIAAHVDGQTTTKWLKEGSPDFSTLLVFKATDFYSVSHPWDLFLINGEQIRRDIELLQPEKPKSVSISNHAVLENREEIYIEDGATVEAGAVLSAENGPIYLGKKATVKAGSIVEGPFALCANATTRFGARIYGDTTVGPVCKVGGEISNTIFHSYSNKAHDGYIGNSVVGQWCNFGAGTTVSNLKINYSNIRATNWSTGKEEDTGQQFLGLIMGDHSKTAINCVINSGSVFGVNTNILSRDFPPKHVESFSWVGSNVIQPYKLDKAHEAMKAMMGRRNVPFTEPYARLMEHIFKSSHH